MLAVVTKRVGDLAIGDQVCERGGALLTVREIALDYDRGGALVIVRFDRYGAGPAPSLTTRAGALVKVMAEVEEVCTEHTLEANGFINCTRCGLPQARWR